MFKFILIILIIVGGFYFIFRQGYIAKLQEYFTIKHVMKLNSTAFADNSQIPQMYTCDAEGVNPPLQISQVMGNSQSLVLLVTDPDAPAGTWTHWVLYNIAPSTTEILEKSVPTGATQGKSTGGIIGYEPPCPPSGTHHYIFTLFALDTSLSLPEGSTQKQVEDAILGHVLDKAQLIGLYSRAK